MTLIEARIRIPCHVTPLLLCVTRGHVLFGRVSVSDTYHDSDDRNIDGEYMSYMHDRATGLHTAVEGPGVHAWRGS